MKYEREKLPRISKDYTRLHIFRRQYLMKDLGASQHERPCTNLFFSQRASTLRYLVVEDGLGCPTPRFSPSYHHLLSSFTIYFHLLPPYPTMPNIAAGFMRIYRILRGLFNATTCGLGEK